MIRRALLAVALIGAGVGATLAWQELSDDEPGDECSTVNESTQELLDELVEQNRVANLNGLSPEVRRARLSEARETAGAIARIMRDNPACFDPALRARILTQYDL